MTEDFTSAGQGYAWTGKSTMTDLERELARLREENEGLNDNVSKYLKLYEEGLAELARLREKLDPAPWKAYYEWMRDQRNDMMHQRDTLLAALRDFLDTPYEPGDFDRLRQLIEEKE